MSKIETNELDPGLVKYFEDKKKETEAAKLAPKHPGIITSTAAKDPNKQYYINSNNTL